MSNSDTIQNILSKSIKMMAEFEDCKLVPSLFKIDVLHILNDIHNCNTNTLDAIQTFREVKRQDIERARRAHNLLVSQIPSLADLKRMATDNDIMMLESLCKSLNIPTHRNKWHMVDKINDYRKN